MLQRTLPFVLFLFSSALLWAQPKIKLVDWAGGFDRPVDIAHCGDSRLFVVEQDGIIWVLDSLGQRLDTFLYIDPRVNSNANEQGLLGLAFHPNYAQNGYFFVYYTKNGAGDTQVSRFSVNPNNPNQANPSSELFILSAAQPYANHNGGCIKFGPDGYLYIGLGDGGSGGDPLDNGQKKNTFLGKILRIDVNNSQVGQPYVVPADNPFVNQPAYKPEIWSLGWRNPWRYSFDRLTGDMWIGDVGQVTREEVDFEPAGQGGRNYGWRCYEGDLPHNTTGCGLQTDYVGPVFDYDNNSVGCSMTGGFVYRGSLYPDLYGVYLNADYCSGRIWGTTRPTDSTFVTQELTNLGDFEFSAFGEDRNGELYVALLASGKVQKITELCSSFQATVAQVFSPVCANSLAGLIRIETTGGAGNVSYSWSNGMTDAQNVYLNPGLYTVTVTDGNGCERILEQSIEQNGPSLPTLTVSDTLICPNSTTLLTASNYPIGSTLIWYRNGDFHSQVQTTGPDFYVNAQLLQSVTYQVRIVDTLCSTLFSPVVYIKVETPLAPEIYRSGDTLFSSQPCTACQWLRNNQPIPGATGDFYVVENSGAYSLEVTSAEGCFYRSAALDVVISETALPASVRRFKLSPNPAHDSLTLEMELERSERFTVSMSDVQQKQLFRQQRQTRQLSLPIDLRSVPPGAYFLKIQLEGGSFTRKIIKQ